MNIVIAGIMILVVGLILGIPIAVTVGLLLVIVGAVLMVVGKA